MIRPARAGIMAEHNNFEGSKDVISDIPLHDAVKLLRGPVGSKVVPLLRKDKIKQKIMSLNLIIKVRVLNIGQSKEQ